MRRAALVVFVLGCGSDPDSGTDSVGTTPTSTATSCTGAANCGETTATPTETSSTPTASASTDPGSSETTSTTGGDTGTSMGTFNPISESGVEDDAEGDSTAAVDCSMTPDCASCWACAKAGPCNAGYSSCESQFNCIPSLICSEQCANDGLQQDCVTTCCMSCTDLMTCPMVDGVISCIEGECAAQCGMVNCP